MTTWVFRIALVLLTFTFGLAIARLCPFLRRKPSPPATAASSNINTVPRLPVPVHRNWPEPRNLDLELSDVDTLRYEGYFVKRHNKTVKLVDWPKDAQREFPEVEVSYATLTGPGKFLRTFDSGSYHPQGNETRLALVSLLGLYTNQLLVSQSIWRGGKYWIVSLTPPVRVIYCSGDWGLGRGENLRAVDIDNDGVDELLDVDPAFDLQDKLAIGQIPMPEVIFKYDARARRYLPANWILRDYLLRDIETARLQISAPSTNNFNHLASVLSVTLKLIYAGEEDEAWAFFDKTYQLPDRDEIRARVTADLRKDAVYQFLYKNRRDPNQDRDLALPESLKAILNQKFPGWKYPKVDDEIRSSLLESVSTYARPDLISGDFDGNGLRDYAVLVEHKINRKAEGAGVSPISLVVFLRTASDFSMHIIENPNGDYLVLMKQGEWDYDYDTQQHFTYAYDAIFTGIFEKAGSSYVYEKGRFRMVITSD